ncbi:MAG: histidine triad nucleotide-binding protein [Spirochaetaceae bacterium]|nr:histidine triad nucleotide-binding protein [Spirochaetaceae bacterium]
MCIFCKIIEGSIPCQKLYEDEEVLAFHDVSPQGPVHFLVIPKRHIPHILEAEQDILGNLLFRAQKIAGALGCAEKGARFVINCKADGGQTVDHLHIHVIGGRPLSWPPG